MKHSKSHILAFATKGSGTNEESRLRRLLENHIVEFLPYEKNEKFRSLLGLLRSVFHDRPELLVMEGTGLAGGLACLLSRVLVNQRYVVSSGDAIGPFVSGIVPVLGSIFGLYERVLCRLSAGFIGWTPYLTGRALTFGAPRAMTASGWSDLKKPATGARHRIRAALGIPSDAIVFGLLGSLVWNRRYSYCYGLELVRAATHLIRSDVRILIIGDGSGLQHLRDAAGDRLGSTILLPGSVPAEAVVDHLAAMDVGSLPQSVDGVGCFRYTTKISEYLAADLPIITGQIPLSYDFDDGWIWRLEGDAPWSGRYIAALTMMMSTLTRAEIDAARQKIPTTIPTFEVDRQVRAVTAFIEDLLNVTHPIAGSDGRFRRSGADKDTPRKLIL